MSRDRMRIFSKSKEHSSATTESSSWDEETKKCFQLQKAMNEVCIYFITSIIVLCYESDEITLLLLFTFTFTYMYGCFYQS